MEKIIAFRTYGGTICTDEKSALRIEAEELLRDNLLGIIMSTEEVLLMDKAQTEYLLLALTENIIKDRNRYIQILTDVK